MFSFALLLVLATSAQTVPASRAAVQMPGALTIPARSTLEQILDALRAVETGSLKNGGRDAIGDDGCALGPMQIHRAYFEDSRVLGRWEDCRDPDQARRVVIAYWKRWCPGALERCDAEVLARVHNGGPAGARKASTLSYWHRVESTLVALPLLSRPAQR